MNEPELQIGVAEFRRRPGNRHDLQRSVVLDDVEVTTASIPAGVAVEVDLVLEALSDGVTVTGRLEVPWTGECRRCLEPTSGVAVAEVREVFKTHADGEDTLPLTEDRLDLGPTVHDAAVLALPLAPLCRADCRGPHPEEFPVIEAVDAPEKPVDPRWAALEELRFDQGASE